MPTWHVLKITLGLNTLIMGSGALISAALWHGTKLNRQVTGFICGAVGILIPAVLMAGLFVLANYGKGMLLLILVYFLAAAIEGTLTVFIYNFFYKVKPEYFKKTQYNYNVNVK